LKTVTGLDRHTGEPFEIVADGVILASHTNQSSALLEAAGHPAAACLNDFRYEDNTAYLHTDTRLMPRRRAAWAAWNYQATELPLDPLGAPLGGAPQRVSVTYWMNVLQSLPFQTPILVSLNPERAPALSHQLETIRYAHPVFDQAALAARQTIQGLQGHDRVWFAGAWMGYGFHEDGFRSGREAAQSMLAWHEACASEEGSRLAA
jgi:predicted NAD/FAD-binding protein